MRVFPKLRYIGVLGTSLKRLDLAYCAANDIAVMPVKEYCDDETAEWVILQILKFFRERPEPLSVYGKGLGVIGMGQVGKKVVSRAQALGLEILRKEGEEPASLERVFANADVISLHTPAHVPWLESRYLERMKKNALLINTCLGRITPASTLEVFLASRPDITLILDKIASASYLALKPRALGSESSAYETLDSEARLIKNFSQCRQGQRLIPITRRNLKSDDKHN